MNGLEIAATVLGKGMCLAVLIMLILYVVQRIVDYKEED